MPVKFACKKCGQKLSVSSSKIGKRSKCPKCGEPLTVPGPKEKKQPQSAEESAEKDDDRADAGADEVDPFAQFVVYDDAELVYEGGGAATRKKQDNANLDRNKVAVSRIVIYVQGVLLGVVAVTFFTFGVFVGSRRAPQVEVVSDASLCVVKGKVLFQDRPDVGAVVMLLPKDAKPDDRPRPDGLRPEDLPLPKNDNDGYRAIVECGGSYARANASGEFTLQVKNSRPYYILYLSRAAKRPAGATLPDTERGQIARYFDGVDDLLGGSAYRWDTVQVDGNRMELKEIVFE